jgi:hypothetical protein
MTLNAATPGRVRPARLWRKCAGKVNQAPRKYAARPAARNCHDPELADFVRASQVLE